MYSVNRFLFVLQAFNFFLVPTNFRVLYVNAATFLWTVFLSYMKHRKLIEAETLSQDHSHSSAAVNSQVQQ